jgi:tetratricopeptide (TPR) repeat protein
VLVKPGNAVHARRTRARNVLGSIGGDRYFLPSFPFAHRSSEPVEIMSAELLARDGGRRSPRLAVTLLVVAAVIAAYLPAIRAPLLYDDINSIDGNPSIRRLWPPGTALSPPPGLAVSGRPIVNYSLALSGAIGRLFGAEAAPGAEPPTVAHHAFNLAIHLACGALLLAILRDALRRQSLSSSLASSPDRVAAPIAALWLIHPIHTEAVNYVVQRTELLVSLFLLATLHASIRARDARGRTRLGWQVAAVASSLLGMGSKEVMIVAPLVVFLYHEAFAPPEPRERRPWGFYAALVATTTWLVSNVLVDSRAGTVGFDAGMSPWQYLYSQCWAIMHYLRLLVWPAPLNIDYGSRPITGFGGIPGLVALTLAGAAAVVAWTRPRWRPLAFLGAWFFLILAPSSSVVPIATEIAAERRVYLASAAILTLIAIGVVRAAAAFGPRPPSRPTWARPTPWVAAGFLILALVTFRRSQLYANPEALYRGSIALTPDNPRAYGNLAALLETDPTRRPEAVALYRQALAVDPRYVFALQSLALMAMEERRFDEARTLYERILEIDRDNPDVLARLAMAVAAVDGPATAIPLIERAARERSDPRIHADLGRLYAADGRLDEAIASLSRAQQLGASDPGTNAYLGWVLVAAGRLTEAIPRLEDAVRAQPGHAEHLARLAVAYAEADRRADAARAAAAALRLPGVDARVLVTAATAFERAGYPDAALAALERAGALAPDDPVVNQRLSALRRRR